NYGLWMLNEGRGCRYVLEATVRSQSDILARDPTLSRFDQQRRTAETLIGAGPFLIRTIENLFDGGGNGPDDGRRPRCTEGGGSAAAAPGLGCPPRQHRGQADGVGGPSAP